MNNTLIVLKKPHLPIFVFLYSHPPILNFQWVTGLALATETLASMRNRGLVSIGTQGFIL